MSLHLDDTRPEPDQIERAITLREAVVASVLFHAALVGLILWLPTLPWMQRLLTPPQVAQAIPLTTPPEQQERPPFVMVEPRIDRETLRRLNRPAPLSDLDREARSRERNPNATNIQPFMRGRSPDLTEAAPKAEKPKGEGPRPEPSPTPATPAPEAATAARHAAREPAAAAGAGPDRQPATAAASALAAAGGARGASRPAARSARR